MYVYSPNAADNKRERDRYIQKGQIANDYKYLKHSYKNAINSTLQKKNNIKLC